MKKTYTKKQIHFINLARKRKAEQNKQQQQEQDPEEIPNKKPSEHIESTEHNNQDTTKTNTSNDIIDDNSPDHTSDTNTINNYSPNYSPLSNNSTTMDSVPMDVPDDISIAGGNTAGGSTQRNARAANGISGPSAGHVGGMRGTVPLYVGLRPVPMRTTRTYTKQYYLRLQNELVETKVHSLGGNTTFNGIRYPYHDLPVHVLGFYLSKTEIQELMQYTSAIVKNVHVGIENKTAVLNFETASSVSTIGNNNVGVYLSQISPDIQIRRSGFLPDQKVLIEERFWGNPFVDPARVEWNSDNAVLGAQYVRRTLSNKFEYLTPKTSDNYGINQLLESELPCFDINPFVCKRINASMNEGLFTEYTYKPKNGLVSAQCWFGAGEGFNSNVYENVCFSNYIQKTMSDSFYYPPDDHTPGGWINPQIWEGHSMLSNGPQLAEMNLARWRNYHPDEWPIIPIENSAIVNTPIKKQDPLIIGIDPLVTELTTSTNNKWEAVKCFVDICVNVTCEVEITQGVDYLNPNTKTIIRPNYMNPHRVVESLQSASRIPQMMENPNIVTADSKSKNFLPVEKKAVPSFNAVNIKKGKIRPYPTKELTERRSQRLLEKRLLKSMINQNNSQNKENVSPNTSSNQNKNKNQNPYRS